MLRLEYNLEDGKKVLKLLVLFELLMVSVFLTSYCLGNPSYAIKAIFDLDGEACLPAWFSATQLLMVGLLLVVASGGHLSHGVSPLFVKWIGLGFIYLSADEAAMIHERAQGLLKHLKQMPTFNGHGVWIILYAALGSIILLVSRRQLFLLWKGFRQQMTIGLVGACLLLLGAVGFEMISYYFLRAGASPFLYVLEVALEELCEMVGVSVILYGVFRFVLQILQEKEQASAPVYLDLPLVTPAGSSILAAERQPAIMVADKDVSAISITSEH